MSKTTALPHPTLRLVLPLLVTSAFLAACTGSFARSYDREMGKVTPLLEEGNAGEALAQLEKNTSGRRKKSVQQEEAKLDDASDQPESNNPSPKKKAPKQRDILYYFEKGELLRLNGEYAQSRDVWRQADDMIQSWETSFTNNRGSLRLYMLNDRVLRYYGRDYEKVFLSTKLMLNHIMLDDIENARVEMKKTYERETFIKNFRKLEEVNIHKEVEKMLFKFDASDLQASGYPMERLDDPEVNALGNGYQNAFAHYLAGYYFEMMGEPSLSDPGYHNALELQPDSTLIRAKTQGKQPEPAPNEVDVLFVVESGQAPAWKSVTIPLPITKEKKPIIMLLSFPVIISSGVYTPASLNVAGKDLPVETIVNVDTMAKRQLKDMMPSIINRARLRGHTKVSFQKSARWNLGGRWWEKLVVKAIVATEKADERTWRTLPARLSIARAILPEGEHVIEFRTAKGIYRGTIVVGGKVNIVPIRITADFVYIGQQEAKGSYTELPPSEWAKLEEVSESFEAIQERISAIAEKNAAEASGTYLLR